jgi:hypothetical protein
LAQKRGEVMGTGETPRDKARLAAEKCLEELETADADLRRLAEVRGQTNDELPLVVRSGDLELRAAVQRSIDAQANLHTALEILGSETDREWGE